MTLVARGLTFTYRDVAIFALPQERVTLEVRGPTSRLRMLDEFAASHVMTVAYNRWTWQAPAEPGKYRLKIDGPPRSDGIDITAFVMVSASTVKEGFLKGYRIGDYPARPLRGDPIYQAPAGFIEVTPDNEDSRVSPHFRLEQFLSHQAAEFPKYLVLNEGLVLALELIGRALEPLDLDADDIHIMSGFRTPFYNRAIGNVEYSLHQWGRAVDIFIDHDRNGMMDDLNRDKKIDRADAQTLYDLLDHLSKTGEGNLIGGLSVYDRTTTHGPFVHVDVRTRKVRW
jgi:peptidase M15-like protein